MNVFTYIKSGFYTLGTSHMIRDFTLTQPSQILLTNEKIEGFSQHIFIRLKLLIVRVLVCRTLMLQVGLYPWS